MKFSCDSCGQRYAIADEKARGKVLKIRCRKCKQVIVVRGQGSKSPAKPAPAPAPKPRPGPAEHEATRMMPASSLQEAIAASRADDAAADDEGPVQDEKTTMMSVAELERARRDSARGGGDGAGDANGAVDDGTGGEGDDEDGGWYAVVGGKQQGPFDDAAFDARVASGRISARTYVWRDGMADWRPAGKVAALRGRLDGDGAAGAQVAGDAGDLSGLGDHPLDTLAEASDVGAISPAADAAAEVPAAVDAPPRARSADDALEALFADIPEGEPVEAGATDNPLDHAIAADDVFSAVPDAPGAEPPPPRETTQMFILASGVNDRRSPLRIAAFVGGFLLVLGGIGYLALYAGGVKLSAVIPLVHHAQATGPSAPVDPAAAAKLRAQLLGLGKTAPAAKANPGHTLSADGPIVQKEKPKTPKLSASQKAALAALYGNDGRGALAIKVHTRGHKGPAVDSTKSPIDPKIIASKISTSERAFQNCVQEQMRRDPKFKGGKVILTLTVAPSGVVTHAKLDRTDLQDTGVAECIIGASRRIVFPSFAGDAPVDFEIPLVLSTGS